MLLQLISVVLRSRQGQSWGDDSFNSRVVGVVQEQGDTIQRPVLLEIGLEEASSLHVDTHCGEDDREVVFVSIVHILSWALDETGLATNLSGNLYIIEEV